MESLLKILNLVATIACISVSISILYNRKNIKFYTYNFSIFLISFFSSLWCANMFFLLIFSTNPKLSYFLARLNWIGSLVVASYTYSSVILATKEENKKLSLIVAILQFSIAIVFSASAFTKLGIKEVVSIFPFKRVFGEIAPLFRIWIIISILYSFYLSFKHYYSTDISIERLKVKYYIFSIVIYALVGVLFNGVFPILGYENFIYFTSIGAYFWVLGLFYSSKQTGLFDLSVMFTNLISYGVFISLGIIINFLLFRFFLIFGVSSLVASTLSIVLISSGYFIFSIKERISTTVKEIVLKDKKNYKKLLEETTKAVIEVLDLEKLLEFVVERLHTALGVSKVAIFLQDKSAEEVHYKLVASWGIMRFDSIYFGNNKIINYIKNAKEPILLDSASLENNIKDITSSFDLLGAVVVIPILYGDELLGIMTIDQKRTDDSVFDAEDINILKVLANQLGVAIKNSMIYKELQDAYMQITRALTLTLESKDEYLLGHTDKVTKYAVILGKKIGLSNKEIYILTQAAMLHDLGKIGIHDYILNKPGRLTTKEMEEVKQHPTKGAKILKSLPFMEEVAYIILHHHEHYDGSGYPAGLKGDEIPLLSRILTLADAIDAMLSERPYKERKMTVEEMLEEIKMQKGKHFDPYLVDKFIEISKEYPEIFMETLDLNYEKL